MSAIVTVERLRQLIIEIRGESVLLDADVAAIYGVETKRVNEAVKNNPDKFPRDYMFELTKPEFADLRSKISTAKLAKTRVPPKDNYPVASRSYPSSRTKANRNR